MLAQPACLCTHRQKNPRAALLLGPKEGKKANPVKVFFSPLPPVLHPKEVVSLAENYRLNREPVPAANHSDRPGTIILSHFSI